MEIAPSAAYHVERTGPDGRDLAVVFEGRKTASVVLVAPADRRRAGDRRPRNDDDTITLAQAMANAEALTPKDPITALNAAPGARARPRRPSRASRRRPCSSSRRRAQPPRDPAPPQPQPPVTAPQTFGRTSPAADRSSTSGTRSTSTSRTPICAPCCASSRTSGLNMIIDPQVQGRVNVLLNDVPWDQALDQILRLEQARLHRRRQHPAHRAAGGARRRAGGAAEAGRRARRWPASCGCRPSP